MRLVDFLLPEELVKIAAIKETAPDHQFAKRVDEEVITPNLERINKTLGQEMDARFLAYAIQNAIK